MELGDINTYWVVRVLNYVWFFWYIFNEFDSCQNLYMYRYMYMIFFVCCMLIRYILLLWHKQMIY